MFRIKDFQNKLTSFDEHNKSQWWADLVNSATGMYIREWQNVWRQKLTADHKSITADAARLSSVENTNVTRAVAWCCTHSNALGRSSKQARVDYCLSHCNLICLYSKRLRRVEVKDFDMNNVRLTFALTCFWVMKIARKRQIRGVCERALNIPVRSVLFILFTALGDEDLSILMNLRL